MDLIIKPTVKCNFKCTFCSSTHLSEDPTDIVELEDIRKFLVRFPDTRTIIVNGGDPLMMPPSYYWSIINMLDELGMEDTSISFTSNLWPFYKNPKKWLELFLHPRMGVGTSFQYGDKRLKGDFTPYTEEEFWKVSDMMLDLVGYRPGFIAVIDEDNKDTAIKTVELAKKMGVVCKINYACASGPVVETRNGPMGNEGKHFMISDIYEIYLQIERAGLVEWEHNTQQMVKSLGTSSTICPLSRNCDEGIRDMQPGGGYYSCGSFGDDGLYPIDFEKELNGELARPLKVYELDSLKEDCYICPMFSICNGCKKSIHDLKTSGRVEKHCSNMKKIAVDIIELNGLTDVLIPTPYVNEEKFNEIKLINVGD